MALDKALLDQIISDNAARGVTWRAGETSMLHLSAAERRVRLGYVPGPGEPSLQERERAAAEAHAKRRDAKPAAVSYETPWSWLDVNGNSYISSIKNQGNCGSCVAFGAAATIDAAMRVTLNDPVGSQGDTLQDVSEAQLFYCGAEGQQGRSCATGWWPSGALAYAQSPGVAPESCFPYEAGDQPCNLCSEWQSEVTTVGAWQTLTDSDAMKTWIGTSPPASSGGPLIACFSVYQDFYAYTSGVYIYNGTAPLMGGHCVSVIGYDDSQEAWLCKNSWGTGWGEQGFFWIGYGQCGIDSAMWTTPLNQIYRGGQAARAKAP